MDFETDRRAGDKLGERYRLGDVVAAGGSSVVYSALDMRTGLHVAVKIVERQDIPVEEVLARFEREVDLVARLQHPNLVQVFDHGVDAAGHPYVVMELLCGMTLGRLLQCRRQVNVGEALRMLLPVMGALSHAHHQGVLHRDLKPDNIFLHRAKDGTIVPKLLDFGVAVSAGGQHRLTEGGVVIGTAPYLAPEQARGDDVSPQTDVWACGVVLYRCLSGRTPFAGTDLYRLLHRIVHDPRPPLSCHAPGVHPRIAAVVDRALERSLERRFATVRDFARALQVTARAQGIAPRTGADPIGLPDWEAWSGAPPAGDPTVEVVPPIS